MTTFLKASCYCGLNAFKIPGPFATSDLPQSMRICHCNTCRHSTGQMCQMNTRIEGVPLSLESTEGKHVPASLKHLTAYKSSAIAIRHFCSICSAHMFFEANEASGDPHWAISSGVLEKTDGILTVGNHIYVGDTLDGGIADHFQLLSDGTRIPRYLSDDKGEQLPLGWKAHGIKATADETLPIHCHCRSVAFFLTRATEIKDPKTEYWLVPGKLSNSPIRFIAAHCLCNSCRLTSGSQIQSWAIVPPKNIFDPTTLLPVDLVTQANRPKGLKQYESSPSKHREFCGTCGASVFWWKTGATSSHIDVSIGLVDQDAVGGSRAEHWLSWYERIIHQEFAISQETAKALTDGIKNKFTSTA